MQKAYTLVRENLCKAAQRRKRYYDLRVKPAKYSVGDWVYHYNPRKYAGKQDKWLRKYRGPYLVVKVNGRVNVTLQRSKQAKPFYTHIEKIKMYVVDELPKSWLTEAGEASADMPIQAENVPETRDAPQSMCNADNAIAGMPLSKAEMNPT